jgi:hypothetical protein
MRFAVSADAIDDRAGELLAGFPEADQPCPGEQCLVGTARRRRVAVQARSHAVGPQVIADRDADGDA